MHSKNQSETESVPKLPWGISVATRPRPGLDHSKQLDFREMMAADRRTEKIWYVLYTHVERPAHICAMMRTTPMWTWAYTKSHARHLARQLIEQGHSVVDIFQGTKADVLHKFRGLK